MALSLRKKVEEDALALAKRLGTDVRDFFSTLLSDLEEASSHASTAVQQADAVIAEHTVRKNEALAEIDANAKLVKGLRTLVG